MQRLSVLLVSTLLLAACSERVDEMVPHPMTLNSGCDAAQGQCVAKSSEGSIALRLGPTVSALQPFDMVVRLEGVGPATVVTIEFEMAGMEMGQNRYVLKPAGEVWRGQGILPFCTTGRSDWIAKVAVSSSDPSSGWHARFPFTVQR